MKNSGFADSQIAELLKRAEAGLSAPVLCREMGVSSVSFLQVAGEVRWYGHVNDGQAQGAWGREHPVREDICRGTAQGRDSERGPNKKVVRLACQILKVSETCYRYEAKKNVENERIADRLLRMTDIHRNWGSGLYAWPAV
jgi:hypothetical protein